MRSLAILCFIFIFSFSSVHAQKSDSKKIEKQAKKEQEFNEQKNILDGLSYNFIATKANPQSGRQVDLSTHNAYFKVINDSLDVYLPFFGRAYSVPFNGSGGIECTGKYTNYDFKMNDKKMNFTIRFKCEGKSDTFDFILTVSRSGNASLSVMSSQRAGISYYGNIEHTKNKQ